MKDKKCSIITCDELALLQNERRIQTVFSEEVILYYCKTHFEMNKTADEEHEKNFKKNNMLFVPVFDIKLIEPLSNFLREIQELVIPYDDNNYFEITKLEHGVCKSILKQKMKFWKLSRYKLNKITKQLEQFQDQNKVGFQLKIEGGD